MADVETVTGSGASAAHTDQVSSVQQQQEQPITPSTTTKENNRPSSSSSSSAAQQFDVVVDKSQTPDNADGGEKVYDKFPEVDNEIKAEDEEIFPDHYYGGGKIPVFKPTMDQFRSFKSFVAKIDHYGMKSGIVKIVPPKEWIDSLPNLESNVKDIRVKNPIEQHIAGISGVYRQTNLEKQKTYNLPQWRNICESSEHQPPARRGERRKNQEVRSTKTTRETRATRSTRASKKKEDEKIANPPTPPSPGHQHTEEEPTPTKRKSKRKKTKGELDEEFNNDSLWDGFDYHLQGVEEFTEERCVELERAYWKSLTYNCPLYGADMPGSLFDDSTTSWNVAHLENILDCLGKKLPGVNTAYLYLGMWKSTFAWHLEDVDLYSINYIHFGAPKQWYSISQEDLPKFEAIMKNIWPNEAKSCSEFLRHKTFLVSPSLLEQRGLKVNRLVHNEGEFVITFPYGYHSGYNLGYNCAESVNFATEAWLEYGRVSKKCECIDDAVWVDVDEVERKLRGEPTEDEFETDSGEDDDGMIHDLPTPPESVGEATGRIVRRGAPQPKKKKRDSAGVKKVKLKLNAPAKEPCVLCPNDPASEEVMKTDSDQQAHRLCAIYTPETYFANDPATNEEIICNIDGIPKARMQLKCYYCRSKKGACFQCSTQKCVRAYHATCAAAAGVLVDMRHVEMTGNDGNISLSTEIDFRCRFHRPKRGKDMDGDKLEKVTTIRAFGRALIRGDLIQAQHYLGDIFAGVVVENRHSEETVVIDVVPSGGLVEVEWKWILATDVAISSFSANSKSAASHKKKNGLPLSKSLNPSQPRPGDPFNKASDKYEWAEFHTTTPTRIQDFDYQIRQYWYYLGEQSTEYIPKYSDNPRKRVPNPEADAVPAKRLKSLQSGQYGQQTPEAARRKSSTSTQLTMPPPPAPASAPVSTPSTPNGLSTMPTFALHTQDWKQNSPVGSGYSSLWTNYQRPDPAAAGLPWWQQKAIPHMPMTFTQSPVSDSRLAETPDSPLTPSVVRRQSVNVSISPTTPSRPSMPTASPSVAARS